MGILYGQKFHYRRLLQNATDGPEGLSLIETLIAVLILSIGLLAAGQLICVTLASSSLSRSKFVAAIQAQDRLEYLADLYRRDPSAPDLSDGNHGPRQVQVPNPTDGATLNRFSISWTVGALGDPRPGKKLPARQVTVTVAPIDEAGNTNAKTYFNKVVSVTAILSAAAQ